MVFSICIQFRKEGRSLGPQVGFRALGSEPRVWGSRARVRQGGREASRGVLKGSTIKESKSGSLSCKRRHQQKLANPFAVLLAEATAQTCKFQGKSEIRV